MSVREFLFKERGGLGDPDTLVTRPLREGLRNAFVVLLIATPIALLRSRIRSDTFIFPEAVLYAVPVSVSVILFCLAHAYLGTRIGRRKADHIGSICVAACLLVAVVTWALWANY